jgi:flagellar FliL protein
VSETTAAIPAPKRSNKKLLIMGGSAVILLAIAGGAGFWWAQKAQAQSPGVEAEAAPVEPEERGIISFEPFVVNLADSGVSRFLRVKVQLLVANAEEAEAIEKSTVKLSQARSIILELLTTQTSDVLVTSKGKAELRKLIAEAVGKSLHTEIGDVLFSDFVVQF